MSYFPKPVPEDLQYTGYEIKELHREPEAPGFVFQGLGITENSSDTLVTFAKQPGDRHPLVASLQDVEFNGIHGLERLYRSGEIRIVDSAEAAAALPLEVAKLAKELLSQVGVEIEIPRA